MLNWLLAVGLHQSNQAQSCFFYIEKYSTATSIWLAIEEMKGASASKWLKILTMLGYLDIVKSQLTKEERIGCQQRSTSGRDYAGEANTTKDGLPCQKWSETKPHDHSFTHVGDHNFCRNPNGVPASEAWCYTTDPEIRETPLQKTPCKFLGIACFLFFWLVGGLVTFHEYKFFCHFTMDTFLTLWGVKTFAWMVFVLGYKKVAPSACLTEGGGIVLWAMPK